MGHLEQGGGRIPSARHGRCSSMVLFAVEGDCQASDADDGSDYADLFAGIFEVGTLFDMCL